MGIPAAEDRSDDLRTDPNAYFKSLSRAEQDKVFTKAGAQAIRDGADISQVVNIRRKGGLYTAGGRKYTRESTTKRGVVPKKQRLTPEQIYKDAAGDREAAITLLRQNGYLAGGTKTATQVVLRDAGALGAVPGSATRFATRSPVGLSAAEWRAARSAISDYRGISFNGINFYLRNPGSSPIGRTVQRVAAIDRAMAASRLRYDVVVYRGVADVEKVFGSAARGDMTGLQWAEDAYMSTSARARVARDFAAPGGDRAGVMEIHVRAGTGAIELSDLEDQAEILLQRGLKPRVVEDRGIVDGLRYLVVEIP